MGKTTTIQDYRRGRSKKQKPKIQINLYKMIFSNTNDFFEFFKFLGKGDFKLKFVRTYWEDSINSIIGKTYEDLSFVAYLPLVHPINGIIARTKSREFYIFKEIINETNRGRKFRPLAGVFNRKRKLEQMREKKRIEKKRQLCLSNISVLKDELFREGLSKSIEPILPKEKIVLTSQFPSKSEVDRFWIP